MYYQSTDLPRRSPSHTQRSHTQSHPKRLTPKVSIPHREVMHPSHPKKPTPKVCIPHTRGDTPSPYNPCRRGNRWGTGWRGRNYWGRPNRRWKRGRRDKTPVDIGKVIETSKHPSLYSFAGHAHLRRLLSKMSSSKDCAAV